MKAILSNYRQAPRKISLIAGLIRGKSVKSSKIILSKLIKRGANPVLKLLNSATANAKENNKIINVDDYIVSITANKGKVLKRWMPRAMGRAFPIHKHTTHIVIELKEKVNK
ncbi:MAG: 50S ribosomal protein L22 [Candidatus Pacebacteria bacterium]|nr:50S ribosomal protein L22 [Candidatus Paceibacterota bacterium]